MNAKPNPLIKLVVDLGPLLIFFFTNAKFGIFTATAAFMVAICVAVVAAWTMERRLPILPLTTGVFVLVFGGATLILQDETFIKLKPTIVNSLFALILWGGLRFDRLFLKTVFQHAFSLNPTGWRLLSWRWIGFFLFLAVLNEAVWRNFSTDEWINFKVFMIMPMTMVFALAQFPLIKRHQEPDEEN